jgi:hypothetical protein
VSRRLETAGGRLQQLPRYVECIGPGRTAAQHHGQQLRIGQGLGATLEQPLAGRRRAATG